MKVLKETLIKIYWSNCTTKPEWKMQQELILLILH